LKLASEGREGEQVVVVREIKGFTEQAGGFAWVTGDLLGGEQADGV